jgi:hypothetical protein
MKAYDIFEKLLNKVALYCMRCPSVRTSPDRFAGTPGELVQRLSPEERAALTNLKSDDLSPDVVRQDQVVRAWSRTPITQTEWLKEQHKNVLIDYDKKNNK